MSWLSGRQTSGTRPAEVITVTINGATFRAGRRTAGHLTWTDEQARERGAWLRIIQPCYNTGVAASAGTHDFDGVVDVEVVGMSWADGQRFLRQCGWAAWWRYPPMFGNHLHAVSLGCPGPVGIYVPAQVDDYYRSALGLKGQHDSGDDPTWHPAPIDSTVFDYPAWEDSVVTPDDIDKIAEAVTAKLLDAKVGNDDTTVRQVLNKVKTWLGRQK